MIKGQRKKKVLAIPTNLKVICYKLVVLVLWLSKNGR